MARPSKHPETGMYLFRKRVPQDVRALVGGPAEVKESLGTKDPDEAERLFRRVDARWAERWDRVRLGVQELDDRQVEAVVGKVYDGLIGRLGNVRSPLVGHSWAMFAGRCEELDGWPGAGHAEEWWAMVEALHGPNLDGVLAAEGLAVTGRTRRRLLLSLQRASRRAGTTVLRQVEGDWSPDPNAGRFPALELAGEGEPKRQFGSIWTAWLAASQPKAGTMKRWRPVLERMVACVGKTDFSRISDKDLEAWINDLRGDDLNNNTIAKVHVAAVKRLFSFAKHEAKVIVDDPAANLKVVGGSRYATAMRGFHPHEAEVILRATLQPPSPRLSPTLAAARRWIPWICAYTGARVNEITQLRSCDFTPVGDDLVMHIRPEAGTAKTGPRDVPLHEHVVAQGFASYLATKQGEQPLFYAEDGRRRGIATPPYEMVGASLGKWVRRLGLTDRRLDPNHAWRHRFKGVSAKAGNDERVTDALQGHAPSSQGRRYGEVDLEERIKAIKKLPTIKLI